MSGNTTDDHWFDKIVEQLRSMDDVAYEALDDGRIALEITYNGENRRLELAGAAGDYRVQKNQYGQMRETLTELGIVEGAEFVAPRRSRKPLSPEMLAARAKQRKEFDAWQEIWRTIRQAEKVLDVEFEISQMLDYY